MGWITWTEFYRQLDKLIDADTNGEGPTLQELVGNHDSFGSGIELLKMRWRCGDSPIDVFCDFRGKNRQAGGIAR
jgi:hypothetical protein